MPDNVGGQQSGPPKNGDTKGKKIGKPGDKKGGAADKAGGFYEKHKYWIWGGGLLLLVVLYFFLSGSKGSNKNDPTAQQQSAADMAAQSGVDPSTGYLWGSPADLAAQGGGGQFGSSGTGTNGPPGPIGAPGAAGKPGPRGKPGKGGDTDFHHKKHKPKPTHHKKMNHRNIHSPINPGGPRIKAPVGHRHQAH